MKNRRFDIMKRKFLSDKGMWLAFGFLMLVIIASIAVDYTGLDPEIAVGGGGIAYDGSKTPRSRSYTLSLSLGF